MPHGVDTTTPFPIYEAELSSGSVKPIYAAEQGESNDAIAIHKPTCLVDSMSRGLESSAMASHASHNQPKLLKDASTVGSGFISHPTALDPAARIPTYPAVSTLKSSIARKDYADAYYSSNDGYEDGLLLTKPSYRSLSTINERKPQVYTPTRVYATKPANTSSLKSSQEAKMSSLPNSDRDGNTSKAEATLASVQSPGAIYIKPSPQLASMQAVGEHLLELDDPGPWTRSKVFMTQSQISIPNASYIPTGSPQSVFDNLGRGSNEKPAEKTCSSSGSSRANEWVEPTASMEASTKWIEEYLARSAEADRLEEAAQRKNERVMKWDLSRMEGLNKIKRRIGGRNTFATTTTTTATTSFEPRSHFSSPTSPLSWSQQTQPSSVPLSRTPQPTTTLRPSTTGNQSPKPSSALSPPPTTTTTTTTTTPLPHQSPSSSPSSSPPSSSPPSSLPKPTLRKRFHTVSGASLSKFILRKIQLGSVAPDHDQGHDQGQSHEGGGGGVKRIFSVNLGRKASVSVRDIVARFERLGGNAGGSASGRGRSAGIGDGVKGGRARGARVEGGGAKGRSACAK